MSSSQAVVPAGPAVADAGPSVDVALPSAGTAQDGLWTGLCPTQPHPLSLNGAMTGSFPLRAHRGCAALRLNRPCLWGEVSAALGFKVAVCRLFPSKWGDCGYIEGFRRVINQFHPGPMRRPTTDAESSSMVDVVFGNVSALPARHSAYWSATRLPHFVSVDRDEDGRLEPPEG